MVNAGVGPARGGGGIGTGNNPCGGAARTFVPGGNEPGRLGGVLGTLSGGGRLWEAAIAGALEEAEA